MTTATVDESKSAFDLEAERIEREAKEQEERLTNKGQGFIKLDFLALEEKKDVVFRIVGRPPAMRKLGSDVKRIFKSEILTDKGGLAQIVWPQELDIDGKETGKLDENFLLSKLYDTVMEKRWDDTIDKVSKKGNKGAYVFFNDKTESYKWVSLNQPSYSLYPVKFTPSNTGEYVMNVISRMSDICKVKKHSVLLSRKASHWVGNKDNLPKSKYESGITKDLYDSIWSLVGSIHKHWDLDIVVTKKSTKDAQNKTNVTYAVTHAADPMLSKATRDLLYKVPNIIELKNGDRAAEQVSLSDEELEYELYNLDALFAPSSYQKIKKCFEKRIKLVDIELKTNFSELLEIEVQKEIKAKGKAEDNTVTPSETEGSDDTGDDELPF